MQSSLKNKLFEAIKGAYPNMFSLERVEALAKQDGYKISNAERRLRELSDGDYPRVRPIRNEKGYIIGYVYIQSQGQKMEAKPVQSGMFAGQPYIGK